MKHWLLFGVLCSGCWDFTSDLATCADSGICLGGDGGRGLGGGGGAGGLDGGARVGDSAPTVASTTFGFDWKFPFPAGGAITAIAGASGDDFYTLGDGDLLLHYQHGSWTAVHPEAPTAGVYGTCLLRFSDGGLLAYDSDSVSYDGRGSSLFASSLDHGAITVRTCALGPDDVPWFGGQVQTAACPGSVSAGLFEGLDFSVATWCGPQNVPAFVLGLDPAGAALTNTAVLRRGDAGWVALSANLDGGYFPTGTALLRPDGTIWAVGANGSTYVVSPDGGVLHFTVSLPTESWTFLSAAPGDAVIMGGNSGVVRCSTPGACAVEYVDPYRSLRGFAKVGDSMIAAGAFGQLARRERDGGWTELAPGSAAVSDVFKDDDRSLWVLRSVLPGEQLDFVPGVAHSTPTGWQTLDVGGGSVGMTRLSDGTRVVVGPAVFVQLDGTTASTIEYLDLLGRATKLSGTYGSGPTSIAGSEPGNTWVIGAHGLIIGWDGKDWRETAGLADTDLGDIWVSDAGTAWVAGHGQLLHYTSHQWNQLGDAGTSYSALWGNSDDDVFYADYWSGVFRRTRSGTTRWSDHTHVVGLAGLALPDGGVRLWEAADDRLSVSSHALAVAPEQYELGNLHKATRLRIIDGTLYVLGSQEGGGAPFYPRSSPGFVLSRPAGP